MPITLCVPHRICSNLNDMIEEDIERRRYEWKCDIPDEICTTHICNECGQRLRGFADTSRGIFRCLDCWSHIMVPEPKGSSLNVEDFARI